MNTEAAAITTEIIERPAKPKREKTGGKQRGYISNPEELRAARDAYILYGWQPTRIAKATGVKMTTLRRWYQQGTLTGAEGARLIEASGGDATSRIDSNALRDKVWTAADAALDVITEKLPKASARDAAAVFATTFDRGRLLDGEATQRVDHRIDGDVRLLAEYGLVDKYGEYVDSTAEGE